MFIYEYPLFKKQYAAESCVYSYLADEYLALPSSPQLPPEAGTLGGLCHFLTVQAVGLERWLGLYETALAEGLGSAPSTHMAQRQSKSLFGRVFSGICGTQKLPTGSCRGSFYPICQLQITNRES